MDLQILKEEAKKFWRKAKKVGEQVLSASADKLIESKYTLETLEEVSDCIAKSAPTIGTDSKTGKEKEFTHRVVILFADYESDFFKTLVYKLPILITKAYSQGVVFRIANIKMKSLDVKKHKISWDICMVVYENKKAIASHVWHEKIQKVVKSPSLDINNTIDTL